jgi:hypothetical protein
MKNIASITAGFIVALLLVAVVGYFGLPQFLKAATADITTDLKALNDRVEKAEAFIKAEEEGRAALQLTKESNLGRIVDRVNSTAAKLAVMEETLKKRDSSRKEETAKIEDDSKAAWAQLRADLAAQARSIDQASRETDRLSQKITLERNLLLVRSRILRARMELSLKNIDTAKKELDLAAELFAKAGIEKNPALREPFDNIQGSFRKTKMEIDLNLPAAIQRMDLLWHELDLVPGP